MPETLVKLMRPARKMKQRLLDSPGRASRLANRDWDAASKAFAASPYTPGRSAKHLLLAAPGINNIGDEAMLEAFLRATNFNATVVVGPDATYDFHRYPPSVQVERMPGIFIGTSKERITALRRFAALALKSASVSIVGADIIDGGYHARSAAGTWALAAASAQAGIDTRVLGFSWKPNVAAPVQFNALRAAEAGVKLLVRDPDSFDRITADGISAELVADTVFTLPRPEESTGLRPRRVLFNVSGLIRSRLDLIPDYVRVITSLQESGYEIHILPHVDNPTSSDIIASKELLERLPSTDAVTAHATLVAPMAVKQLADTASFVVTGRMHLAVLALSMSTPAIVLATQGKVSGLMQMFDMPEMCIEPKTGCAEEILDRVRQIEAGGDALRGRIESRLSQVTSLAHRNFRGIGSAERRAEDLRS